MAPGIQNVGITTPTATTPPRATSCPFVPKSGRRPHHGSHGGLHYKHQRTGAVHVGRIVEAWDPRLRKWAFDDDADLGLREGQLGPHVGDIARMDLPRDI